MAEKTDKQTVATVSAKVHFYISDDLVPRFADVTFVSHTPADFRLSFYATVISVVGTGQAPEMTGEGEDREPVIKAKCVAQIVLTPDQAKGLMEALQSNYASFVADTSTQRGSK